MYLPRHQNTNSKSKTNFSFIFVLIFLFSIFGITIWKWKQISFYFSGNSKLKISKVEDSILENIKKGKIPKSLISEYKTIANIYFDSAPTDANSNFVLAKTAYYEIYNYLNFDNRNLVLLNSLNANLKIFESPKLKNEFEIMYRSALRAKAFNPSFSENEQNNILIYLFEGLSSKKNKVELVEELNKTDFSKLSLDMKKLFLSLSFIIVPSSGNIEYLEKYFLLNDTEKIFIFSKEEISYLKAVTYYNKKDLLKALELFRESKSEINFTNIEATRYEADIFFRQNLHEKAILILEELYKNTGSTNQKIIVQIKEIISTKPSLKSKLDI